MILVWASPFNSAGRALSSKINLLRQKQRYCSKCGAAIEWLWASFIFVGIPQLGLLFISQALGILYITRQKHQITQYIGPMLM